MDIRKPSPGTRVLRGGLTSYQACRKEARRLRAHGVAALEAPSAALTKGGAGGWVVDGGEREGPPRDGKVYALFGRQPNCIGRPAVETGTAPVRVRRRVQHP